MDARLSRPVALKVLHPRFAHDSQLSARLASEVRITASLSHPGIVAIYDYTEEDGETCLAMELMTGGDLRRRILAQQALSVESVESIARQILEALAVAHAAGVIHRDIKPRNVLFDDVGRAKIADFGLAQSAIGGILEDRERAPGVAGTAEYLAPEAISGGLWDARTDLYALGCTLYEALTGRPPFVANTPDQVLRLQLEAKPPSLPESVRACAPLLARMVEVLLEKDPNNRFQSAEEALHSLEAEAPLFSTGSDGETISCAWCGKPVSRHYPWCFSCGKATVPAVREARGGYVVVIRGPGKPGEQMKPEWRDACCAVAEGVGLDTSRLRKRLPRFPFVMVRGINRAGARRIAEHLTTTGMDVEIVGAGEGSRFVLAKSVGRKTLAMAPRIYLIMMGMGGSFVSIANNAPGTFALGLLGAALASVPAVLGIAYSRPVVEWKVREVAGEIPAVTDVLLTVSDPLLHARMRSITGDAQRLLAAARNVQVADDSEGASLESAVSRTVTNVAQLACGLSTLKESVRAATLASVQAEQDEHRREALAILRGAEATYTKSMERIGRVSLRLRRLALKLSGVSAAAAAVELSSAGREVQRIADEVGALHEIEDYLEKAGDDRSLPM